MSFNITFTTKQISDTDDRVIERFEGLLHTGELSYEQCEAYGLDPAADGEWTNVEGELKHDKHGEEYYTVDALLNGRWIRIINEEYSFMPRFVDAVHGF